MKEINKKIRQHTGKNREVPGMFNGPFLPLLIRLAVQMLVGMLFQLLYNLTDMIWVSRIDLTDASYVGGIGLIFPLFFLVIAAAQSILIGVSSLVARAVGEKKYTVLDRTAESGMALAAIITVIMLGLFYPLASKMVSLTGAKGSYYTHALDYLTFILPGLGLIFFGNTFTGILQGQGRMKQVMTAMIIGTAGNIILDPLFIFLLGLGIKGAAIATVIAQSLTVFYLFFLLITNRSGIRVQWKLQNIDPGVIKEIIRIGFPQFLAMGSLSFSFMLLNRIVIFIDPNALTAFALCGNIERAIMIPIFAIGSALITMIGQNFGRRLFGRVKEIYYKSLCSAAILVLTLATLLFSTAHWIYPFFSEVEDVVKYAVTQTRIMAFSFLFATIGILARSMFQAIGRPWPGLVLTLSRLFILAVPIVLLYVYIFNWGMYGIWFGLITANGLGAVLSLIWSSSALKSFQNRDTRSLI